MLKSQYNLFPGKPGWLAGMTMYTYVRTYADIFQTGVLLEEDEEPFLRLDEEDMRHINRMSLLSYESNTSNQSPFLEDATQFGSSSG